MTGHWWMQVKAVIRLELKKTFFAKRGLWIYVVAALPVVLYVAYAVATSQEQHRTVKLARKSERPLTYQDLRAIKPGMTKEEVTAVRTRLCSPASFSSSFCAWRYSSAVWEFS